MASYKTYIPTTHNEYIPSVSADDFKLGLQVKQQQYDVGRQAVQDNIDNMFKLEVFRDVDKQYLNDRHDEIINSINKYSTLDLSNPNNAYQLAQQITPLYKDKNILNAVESNAKIKSLYSSIQTLKEKHPDKYSPLNEEYDMSHVAKYGENQELGKKYDGPVSPTLYFDYKKELRDAAEDLKSSKYKDEYGNEKFGVDPSRVKNNLSQGALQQIQLEFEMSGAKTTDPIKARNSIAADLAELDKVYVDVPKDSPYYSQYQEARGKYEQLLNNPNDEMLLSSVNQMELNGIINNLASSVSYDQDTTSPMALENLKYLHQTALQNARISSNERMNTERVNNQGGKKGNGEHYAIDDIMNELDNKAKSDPNQANLDINKLGRSIRVAPGLSGKSRFIVKIEKNENGTYNYYMADEGINKDTQMREWVTQPGGDNFIGVYGVTYDELTNFVKQSNKPIKEYGTEPDIKNEEPADETTTALEDLANSLLNEGK